MVVTVGVFDGVHMGHRRVLRALLEKGQDAAAVTFWPHPRIVLQKDADGFALLNSQEEKQALINSCGVKDVRCVKFTKLFAETSAESFIRNYLIGELGCTCLVLGYDNRVGSDALDTADIASIAREMGIEVEIVPPCVIDDINVSSTRIRICLAEGDVVLANKMLGYNYALDGIVVSGNHIGRSIGFPTANLALTSPLKAIPANGVYAVEVELEGKRYKGMTNIGTRPTVGISNERVIETNIFDFSEDIYGKDIRLEFVARVREEKQFDSLDALRNQLNVDRHRCYGFN